MKPHRPAPAITTGLVLLASALSLVGDSVTLQPAADTCLFSFSPDNNMGAEARLILGGISEDHAGEKGRVLVRFDLSAIPAGSTITAAQFSLEVLKQNDDAVDSPVGMYRMLRSWAEGGQEGSNGSPAEAGESTWIDRVVGTEAWGSPGGQPGVDFESTASSVTTVENVERYAWPSTAGLVSDLQLWVNQPTANFGWMLLSNDEETSFTARRVASRELEDLGPQLVIEYTPAVQITPPEFSSVALKEGLIELRFNGEPGNLYTIYHNHTPDVGTANILTNIPVKLFAAEAVVTDPTDQPQRFYRLAITAQID